MAAQELCGVSDRSGIIGAAFDEVLSHAWLELEVKNLRWSGRHDAAQESLRNALAIVDVMYPARQKSEFTPISMIQGSWKPQEEPQPPALERWVGGYLSWEQLHRGPVMLVAHPTPAAEIYAARSAPCSEEWLPIPPCDAPALVDNFVAVNSSTPPAHGVCPAPTRFNTAIPHTDAARLREELDVRKHQRAVLEAKREAGEVERRHLESVRQQFRGQQYAYDHRGQLVLVLPVDMLKLPRPMAPGVGPDESADGVAVRKYTAASAIGDTKDGAAKPKNKKRQLATDFIERPKATGPSPIDTIQLQPGATIKGPQGMRSGGACKQDHAHMTRAEFQAFAERKAAARSMAGFSPFGKT